MEAITMKEHLKQIKEFIIEQIWRIQIIQGLYGVLVFTPLLILANSEKIQQLIPINTYLLVILGTPALIFLVWIAGMIMDGILHYQQSHDTVANKRNPQICEILERLERLEEKINKLKNHRKI